MSFPKPAISLLIVTSTLLLLQTASGADPLFHFCSGEFANDAYKSNLNKLVSYLSDQSPQTGFSRGSVGLKQDQAYGLALCRGDATATDCKTCVVEASSEIQKRCPSNKTAIIWYDNCLLKYTNKEFFGRIDNENKFYMWNVQVVNDSVPFNQKTKELLTQLAKEAQVSPKLYATGQSELDESSTLYGLAQCTRDLAPATCKNCLDGIIGELPSCCDGKEGGRVVSGSCNFRYEIYPFVNA